MIEEQADDVMFLISSLQAGLERDRAMLDHLFNMHKLRDERLWDELSECIYLFFEGDERGELFDRMIPMQTHFGG